MPAPLLKRAQTQLLEVLAVMIILTIITVVIILAASYYTGTQDTRASLEDRQERAQTTTDYLRTRTELRCPETISTTALCIDAIRAHSLAAQLNNSPEREERYFDLFGPTTITITPVYPDNPSITLYDEPPQNYTSTQRIQTPISYYNATTDTNHFAVLNTTIYR
jgi:type II secretory pathway pseudopilin PulG